MSAELAYISLNSGFIRLHAPEIGRIAKYAPLKNVLTVSVIIPVYRGGDDFRRCLVALLETTPPPQEIIIVVDGNHAEDHAIVEEMATNDSVAIHLLSTPTPLGPAQARNRGVEQATGDIVFFVDADVALAHDAIEQMVNAFDDDDGIAAVFGSYDDEPADPHFLSQYKNLLHHYVHQTGNEDASTFWSGCGAVRREVFLQMSGFSSAYSRPSIEDIELGYRLRKAGYRIVLRKSLQGKHLKRWTAVSLVKTDFFQRALPWTDLILRDKQMANDLNLDTSSRLSVVLAYGLIGTLLGAILVRPLLAVSGLLIGGLLLLNRPTYRFLWEKRGSWFALRALPWHWLYYLYSGLAFGIGTIRHMLRLNQAESQSVQAIRGSVGQ